MSETSHIIMRCGTLVLPNGIRRECNVRVVEGQIVEIAPHMDAAQSAAQRVQVIDATRHIVLPGFIDIHVHGAMNADVMDATPEALYTMARHFAAHGITGFCPTTVTAARAQIDAAIDTAQRTMALPRPPGTAQILGVHIEGPYLNPKRAGAQPREHMRPADPDEYGRWFASGCVKLITVAPEIYPSNLALIVAAKQAGIAVALGHTDATFAEAQVAFGAGANQATHTYNGMRPLHHREPGVLGAVMAECEIYAQLICDGFHVHPAAIQALYLCKGSDRLVIISDAIRASGLPDGDYAFVGQQVRVHEGQARLKDGELAGSTATMDAGFRNILRITGCTLVDAAQMCATSPAASLGLGTHKGKIAPGFDADIAVLDADLNVVQTVVNGQTMLSNISNAKP